MASRRGGSTPHCRRAGAVQLVKIHGPERDCALALAKKARRAALTHKNGYTCHGCARRYAAHARLRKHMLQKHLGHDESLRPQPRAKPKRKEMRTEAQSQGEGSGPLGPAGDGDVDAERPRKRPRLVRHTDDEEGEIMCVADAEVRTNSGIRWFGTRARIIKTLRQ
ncbi:hypothetical protein ERJ75_000834900 [Trypanosoma vivax]|nr:hypothetical protein ERJ75_000834900 [Trypanosoma vivax]